MLTVLTQRPPLLSGNWDESYWRGPSRPLWRSAAAQAVRLPVEFRFEGSEVDIRRDPVTGEVVLSKPTRSWDDYFDWARTLDLPDDFLEKRDQPKDDLRDRLPKLVTLPVRWPKPKHSSDLVMTENVLRCCLHISSAS
jgi:antitoxin VapB